MRRSFRSLFFSSFLLGTMPFVANAYITGFDIPLVDDSPSAHEDLNFEKFEKISQILYSSRMAPHLNCMIKTRTIKEERRFLSGKKFVEVLQIEYWPRNQYAAKKISFKIPAELASFGAKLVSNQWSGSGEDIRIEMNDYYNHWIRFIHDGRGQIVRLNVGNSAGTYPCSLK